MNSTSTGNLLTISGEMQSKMRVWPVGQQASDKSTDLLVTIEIRQFPSTTLHARICGIPKELQDELSCQPEPAWQTVVHRGTSISGHDETLLLRIILDGVEYHLASSSRS